MRKTIVALLMLATIGGTILAGAVISNDQLSCEAEAAVTVGGVAQPSCTITFFCSQGPALAFPCFYEFDLSVNGTGQVTGSMKVEALSPATAEFVDDPFGDSIGDTRECSGLFSCNDRTLSDPNKVIFLRVHGFVTLTCTGGGLSAFEHIGCRLTREETFN